MFCATRDSLEQLQQDKYFNTLPIPHKDG